MTVMQMLVSELLGRKLISVGKRKFKNGVIKDFYLRVYDGGEFEDAAILVCRVECEDKNGRKLNRDVDIEFDDDFEIS